MEYEMLHDILQRIKYDIARKQVVAGFDGFIDHIVRPVNKSDDNQIEFFDKMASFSTFLSNHNDMSCSIELKETDIKIGGNNPIMSHALGQLGAHVSSVGAYGNGVADPVFNSLSSNCTIYPVAESGRCFALEFDNNKLMLFVNNATGNLTYDKLKTAISEENLMTICEKADLISLLNYSELPSVFDIWQGLLNNIFPKLSSRKLFFFDLSDCSRVKPADLKQTLQFITEFKSYGSVYLDMNDNELLHVYQAVINDINHIRQLRDLLKKGKVCDVSEIQQHLNRLYKELNLDCVILRTLNRFYAYDKNGIHAVDNIITKEPKLLTGAGDNQNAGICAGLICGQNIKDAMRLGALVGSFYTRHGFSPTLEQLEEHLSQLVQEHVFN